MEGIVTVIHADSGQMRTVPGFSDGDNARRLRVMPDDPGTRQLRTHSQDPRRNGQEATLECVPAEKPYLRGASYRQRRRRRRGPPPALKRADARHAARHLWERGHPGRWSRPTTASPADREVKGQLYRTNFCLAKPGAACLVFSLLGGPLAVIPEPGTDYQGTRIDRRSGAQADLGTIAGMQQLALPEGEQVLVLKVDG